MIKKKRRNSNMSEKNSKEKDLLERWKEENKDFNLKARQKRQSRQK